jgi:hypothetical protein
MPTCNFISVLRGPQSCMCQSPATTGARSHVSGGYAVWRWSLQLVAVLQIAPQTATAVARQPPLSEAALRSHMDIYYGVLMSSHML